jgi:1-acyl-sn-glycerol-3-phosphate acyltransferase
MKLYSVFPFALQKIIWIPTRILLVIFGRLKIVGLENLSSISGGAIFAMNHSSEVDPFMVPSSLPFFSPFSPIFYATREKSFYTRSGWRKHLFGGTFIKMWGGYGVRAGLHDYARSLEEHLVIAKAGGSFCFFPEGGITDDGKLRPGKGGIGFMAHRSGLPVVPVALKGAFGMSLLDFFMRRRKLTIVFGKPIEYAFPPEASVEAYKTYAGLLMEEIGGLLDQQAAKPAVLQYPI